MSANASYRAGAIGGSTAAAPPTHALTAGESAWLAVVPCALALIAVVAALGPPLGHALFAPPANTGIWTFYVKEGVVEPEPVEHARYVLALLGPLLVGGGVLALAGRSVRSDRADALAGLARAALVAFVLVCVAYQEIHVPDEDITSEGLEKTVYFSLATLVVALALTGLATWALSRADVRARLTRLVRETTAKRVVAIAVASVFVLVWLLSAFNTDASLTTVNRAVSDNVPFWLDEGFAVLNGHAPLVDFHPQYGQLWAYISGGALGLFGGSFGTYAVVMLAGTAGAMAAVYATLRRLAGSSLAALALFLPFVATSFFMEIGPLDDRYGPANLFSLFPMRYGGPFLLLWLVVRRVARRTSAPPVLLFALAGLVAINNMEFGVPAFGATAVALLVTEPRWSLGRLARLAGSAVAGIVGAIALVSLLTLLQAGSLPHFGDLLVFPRIYGVDGFGMLPMPLLGLHLVVYVTCAAALAIAVVRAVDRDADGGLTAALAWAGVFGLGAGAYFVGRSHPHVLIDIFSAWALALSLLTIVVVRAVWRRQRRPTLVELLVLAGFALTICSLAQTPAPWSQVQRLQEPARADRLAPLVQQVRQFTHDGEHVALLLKNSHRIAHEVGIDDVTPYANIESMISREQWSEMLAALRNAHGSKIILPTRGLRQEHANWLIRAGYGPINRGRGLIVLARRPDAG